MAFLWCYEFQQTGTLNKHVLRTILNAKASTYEMLLESLGLVSLRERTLLDMLILGHKSFQVAKLVYILALLRTNINSLRDGPLEKR